MNQLCGSLCRPETTIRVRQVQMSRWRSVPLPGRLPLDGVHVATVFDEAVYFLTDSPSAKYSTPNSSAESTNGNVVLSAVVPLVAAVNEPLRVNVLTLPFDTARAVCERMAALPEVV